MGQNWWLVPPFSPALLVVVAGEGLWGCGGCNGSSRPAEAIQPPALQPKGTAGAERFGGRVAVTTASPAWNRLQPPRTTFSTPAATAVYPDPPFHPNPYRFSRESRTIMTPCPTLASLYRY